MKKSGMYNFLIELLIVIVFFALSMIVVVNIFNKGDVLGDKTRVLNEAHSTYISVIEKMKVYDGEELDTYLKDYDLDKYYIEVNVKDNISEVMVIYNDEVLSSVKVMSVGDIYE
ncbi:MAG: hypothetical protein SOW61_03480 [Erysipelotrichaceae bacterium]|nr:hypothetical protein [Erysipelotrichaceae bacterium]